MGEDVEPNFGALFCTSIYLCVYYNPKAPLGFRVFMSFFKLSNGHRNKCMQARLILHHELESVKKDEGGNDDAKE